jgi:hypothetical protein
MYTMQSVISLTVVLGQCHHRQYVELIYMYTKNMQSKISHKLKICGMNSLHTENIQNAWKFEYVTGRIREKNQLKHIQYIVSSLDTV